MIEVYGVFLSFVYWSWSEFYDGAVVTIRNGSIITIRVDFVMVVGSSL